MFTEFIRGLQVLISLFGSALRLKLVFINNRVGGIALWKAVCSSGINSLWIICTDLLFKFQNVNRVFTHETLVVFGG